MLPPLADLEAFSARLGTSLVDDHGDSLETDDAGRALAALEDASTKVRLVAELDFVSEDGELDFGELPEASVDVLRATTIAAALRAYRNPYGATQASVGDVSLSYGRAAGAIYLTRDEERAIRRAVRRSGVGSIPLVSPYPHTGPQLIAVSSGEPMVFGPQPWEAI